MHAHQMKTECFKFCLYLFFLQVFNKDEKWIESNIVAAAAAKALAVAEKGEEVCEK